MYDKGIGGFFIHARFGLETPYLSDEWFEDIRLCAEEAEKLGLEVWLYDENPFPSGIGGLKVSSQPEYRNIFMECREFVFEPGFNPLPAASGNAVEAGSISEGSYTHIEIINKDGIQGIFNAGNRTTGVIFTVDTLRNDNGFYFGIDYMNPDAFRCFLESTHEKYADKLGDLFGGVIKGIFTDEPTLLPWHQDLNWYTARCDGRVSAWDVRIPEALESRGLSLSEVLAAVFLGSGDEGGLIRRIFWEIISSLYETSFFKAYKEWCANHGLLFTGHVLLEEGLYFNHIFQGNIIRDLEYMDMPGIDQLCNTAEQYGMGYMVGNALHLPVMRTNMQGQKTVSSSAHLSGKKRVLSESFGLGSWELSLRDMKKVIDWQYSLGINQLCVHAVFYSIEGFRKYEAPPCHMHNSFWPYYRIISDYTARLSYALTRGIQSAEAAVLYPSSAFRSVYRIGLQETPDRNISDVFDLLCAVLPKIHIDYEVVGEHHLGEAGISDRLCISGETFSVAVIPSFKGLGEKSLAVLKDFLTAGGTVLFWGEPHSFGCSSGRLIAMDPPTEDDMPEGKNFAAALKAALTKTLNLDIQIKGPGNEYVYALNRKADGNNIYFFANTSDSPTGELEISVSAAGQASVLDAVSGKVYPAVFSFSDGRTVIRRSFAPYESLLLYISPEQPLASVPAAAAGSAFTRTELGGAWDFDISDDNVYPVNNWNFNVGTGNGDAAFTYRSSFFVNSVPETLSLMLDDIEYRTAFMGQMNLTVTLNGTEVSLTGTDKSEKGFKLYDLLSAVKDGNNEILIAIRHSAWSGEPHLITSPVKLRGRFSCSSDIGIPGINCLNRRLDPGSWTSQGYPYYSGTGIYRKIFVLESLPGSLLLDLDGIAEGAEVYVNGQKAGIRAFAPYNIDISDYTIKGENLLEIHVFNTMINSLEYREKPSGLLKPPSLMMYDL